MPISAQNFSESVERGLVHTYHGDEVDHSARYVVRRGAYPHPLVDRITTPEQRAAVNEYRTKASLKRDLDRTDLAKDKCETLRTDGDIFDVWAEFVVSSEKLSAFAPHLPADADGRTLQRAADGMRLILQGRDLLLHQPRAGHHAQEYA